MVPPEAPATANRGSIAPLDWAHPIVLEWFAHRFGDPTEPQELGWPAIAAGRTTLISAPTGSGKTLAAFLFCIDRLLRQAISGTLCDQTEVVYVSPLKALSNDIEKNLAGPLAEIQRLAIERGFLCPEIRAAVRTGDTLPAERRKMLKHPPHILVTTPESLYILLTAEKSRNNLRQVQTVIVDEIHSVAGNKRGAHLMLSLERLDALVTGENHLMAGASICGLPQAPQRIGLSATQNPIELVAEFLGGSRAEDVAVIEVGKRRPLDLAIELPKWELGPIATMAVWDDIYARLAELAREHRSTLLFVNTRRLVERLAFALGERLGTENVAAHHGSLSRKLRLEAEQKLKAGAIRILVATASLEMGIDIGAIDLVCQINSTRAISTAMQRVGRAGHWRGAIPKGRLFPTTRDDLVECAALARAMRAGALDRLEIPDCPLDVLMQQIVAACAAEPWEEDALFRLLTRARPYVALRREEYEEILDLLAEGVVSSRGRYGAYLLRDRVNGHLRARRGARSIAVLNGGAIPDSALFTVIMQPQGISIATLDEDFATESSPGDIILLGNTSWRIQRVESSGRVLVEDAQGQPPSVPFWRGEAPQRTADLSGFVSDLRQEIAERSGEVTAGYVSQANPRIAKAVDWLKRECAVDDSGAEQLIAYITAAKAALGAIPTTSTLIAERFFDEGGGMQLVIHAPFGGRINKAWGLALRKRFCRGFNFELQAAATDNGLNLSLAEQHSFPLSDVFDFLTEETVTALLEQASLASPIFRTRWRWDAGRSLQLLRFRMGKRVAPQVQRTRSDDLLASVFPEAAACQENIEGDIKIPSHPLVREVMKDVLGEAMDLAGLIAVLRGIRSGGIQCLSVDSTAPSPLTHEILNAHPYSFLDGAPLEERRARAVQLRGIVPESFLGDAARLDPEAIRQVREECRFEPRDEHELHDLIHSLILAPESALADLTANVPGFLPRLEAQGRATIGRRDGCNYIVAAERAAMLQALWPDIAFERALRSAETGEPWSAGTVMERAVQAWMDLLGPVTAQSLGDRLGVEPAVVWQAMLVLETRGTILRGVFEAAGPTSEDLDVEWCERRLLQRIHKRTLAGLRRQIEPISPAIYMQWLLRRHGLTARRQLSGEQGVLDALRQLEGFEAPAAEWEQKLLPQRVAGYDPHWLDNLCIAGVVGWGRISPHPAFSSQAEDQTTARRIVPTRMSPITFFFREEAQWMDRALANRKIPNEALQASLSDVAWNVRAILERRGACFAGDLARALALPAEWVNRALWELVAAGLVTADGFDCLRALIDPRRRLPGARYTRRPRAAAGRWSLLAPIYEPGATPEASFLGNPAGGASRAARQEQEIESACQVLLRRYGVVFRSLIERESTAPPWRELAPMYRRLEARGQIRGGRFVDGFGGEQFALPEAIGPLREMRNHDGEDGTITIAAADPANLAGIVVPGERVPGIPGRTASFVGGLPVEAAQVHDQIQPAASA